jgi:RNA polymerase sigma-70 factor (ECF subfamily)
VIREPASPHHALMDAPELVMPRAGESGGVAAARPAVSRNDGRITAIVRAEHDFIWRLLRRLGVPESSVDDMTQQVFCIAARRVEDIKPGSERSFLFGAALRVASDCRRSREFRDRPQEDPPEEIDPGPNPEELTEKRQRRALLQETLMAMPIELRTLIILFELDQMTKAEVAELLGIPEGTAVSRLRRAREEFKAVAKRKLREGVKARP